MENLVFLNKSEYIKFLYEERNKGVYVYESEFAVTDDMFPCLAIIGLVVDQYNGEELTTHIISKNELKTLVYEME